MNNDNYGDWSNVLEGTPHSRPHIYVREHMATYYSPDDPLFWMHHTNVDRIWAIWQDYHDQDTVAAASLGTDEYDGSLDGALQFNGAGLYGSFFFYGGMTPTPREVHHLYEGAGPVRYMNDNLAMLLTDATDESTIRYEETNNPNWIDAATSTVGTISCSRRRELRGSKNELRQLCRKRRRNPEQYGNPPFSKTDAKERWENKRKQSKSPKRVMNEIAQEECDERGNPLGATPKWIAMMGMEGKEEYFACHFEKNAL